MLLLFIVIGVFFLGKWIIESIFLGLFNEGEYTPEKTPESKTIIHNHITENHLHISKEDFEALQK